MYGLVHRAMREMVIEAEGHQAWQAIETEQAIGPGELISLSVYDDALTMRLLGAVSDTLNLPIDQTLRAFGRHWIKFVSTDSYHAILDFAGRDLPTLLRNLNRMHQTVRFAMPSALVPSFTIVEETEDQICVEYRSERTGLEPMVIGLLEGLITKFNLSGQVEKVPSSNGAGLYRIQFSA